MVPRLPHFTFLVKKVDLKFPAAPQEHLLKIDWLGTTTSTIKADLHKPRRQTSSLSSLVCLLTHAFPRPTRPRPTPTPGLLLVTKSRKSLLKGTKVKKVYEWHVLVGAGCYLSVPRAPLGSGWDKVPPLRRLSSNPPLSASPHRHPHPVSPTPTPTLNCSFLQPRTCLSQ